MADPLAQPSKIKVWDIGTRLFHWALVLLFSMSAFSAFQDKFGIYADIHLYSGFGILVLVSWRIIWGFWGSETARFGQFVRGPRATFGYAKSAFKRVPYHWIGHNPLGAWSVIAMLFLLLVQAGLGLFATDGMIFSGPFSSEISDSMSSAITGWHEILGFVLLGLIGLHIIVIAAFALVRRVNLVVPMITGHKISDTGGANVPEPRQSSPLKALGLFLLAGGLLYWLVFQ